MIGAVLGDMIGAPYEFDRSPKKKEFPLFTAASVFTDDTVMSLAVADALISAGPDAAEETVKSLCVQKMQAYGRKYPDAGYGGRFRYWLTSDNPKPYGSFGNGSAMRVSSAGWLYDTLPQTITVARWSAEVTHNHPEGVKGAESTAAAIFLARTGKTKCEIRRYISDRFGYDFSRTCDEIRPSYHHVETCQGTVPEAMTAFFEGTDFTDVIRTAVSLGGDCDTLTCIAGSIAEAFYGVPAELAAEGMKRLTPELRDTMNRFRSAAGLPPLGSAKA